MLCYVINNHTVALGLPLTLPLTLTLTFKPIRCLSQGEAAGGAHMPRKEGVQAMVGAVALVVFHAPHPHIRGAPRVPPVGDHRRPVELPAVAADLRQHLQKI